MRERPRFGSVLLGLALILGGVSCVLAAVALGFYLTHESAAVMTANWQQANEMVAQNIRSGMSNYNVNVPHWEPPVGVPTLMWGTFAVGSLLALLGIGVGLGSPRRERSAKGTWPEV